MTSNTDKKSTWPELQNMRPLLLPSAMIYVALVMLMPRFGHSWDVSCWGLWATRMHQSLVEAYSAGTPVNYLPLYMYVLKIYGWICGVDHIYKYLYMLKAFTLLFDIGSMLLLCSMVNTESRKFRYFIYGLFNIGFLYNTLVWNQVDGILTFFIFASFIAAMKQRPGLSFFLFLLALNFKLQGIVFLPVIGLLWLPFLKPKTILKILGIAILTQGMIMLPFFINGNAKNVFAIVRGSVDYYKIVSLNAYNLWHLLFEGDLMHKPDNVAFIGSLTYKHVGLILFMSFSALVLVPLYIRTIRKMITRENTIPGMKTMLLAVSLIICFFFFFNTQMHERYLHPLIIFSTALAFFYGYWGQWIVFSLAYALSLESICRYLELPKYSTMIFNPDFIACLYAIGMLMLLYRWYRTRPFKKEIVNQS